MLFLLFDIAVQDIKLDVSDRCDPGCGFFELDRLFNDTGLVYSCCMRSFIFFFCLIIVLPCSAGEVFKWTSQDGQTTYSDIYRNGAEKLSIAVGKTPQARSEQSSDESAQVTNSSSSYQAFEIAQPQNDETIRNDGGVVEVGLSLSPNLTPGHVIHVYVDGNKLQTDLTTTQFSLNELNRGTHTLQAKVVDADGKPQIVTPSVSFHLRQAATANP
jgi:hypothetical protein